MSSRSRILTFELLEGKDQLELHCNEEGLVLLIECLTKVLRTGEHEHLMTSSWGGSELTEEAQGIGNQLINKVTVHLWR